MAGSVTISLPNLSAGVIGSSKRSEASEIQWWIDNALRQMVASGSASVSITDRAGTLVGTLSWTPVNTT